MFGAEKTVSRSMFQHAQFRFFPSKSTNQILLAKHLSRGDYFKWILRIFILTKICNFKNTWLMLTHNRHVFLELNSELNSYFPVDFRAKFLITYDLIAYNFTSRSILNRIHLLRNWIFETIGTIRRFDQSIELFNYNSIATVFNIVPLKN